MKDRIYTGKREECVAYTVEYGGIHGGVDITGLGYETYFRGRLGMCWDPLNASVTSLFGYNDFYAKNVQLVYFSKDMIVAVAEINGVLYEVSYDYRTIYIEDLSKNMVERFDPSKDFLSIRKRFYRAMIVCLPVIRAACIHGF